MAASPPSDDADADALAEATERGYQRRLSGQMYVGFAMFVALSAATWFSDEAVIWKIGGTLFYFVVLMFVGLPKR